MSKNFFDKYDIIPTAIATIVSSKIDDLAHSFVDNLILPVLDRDADGDGEKDVKRLEEYTLKTKGINFKVGKFFVEIIKFILVLAVLFTLSKLFNNNASTK